jgi:hypothetical protein
LQNMYHVLPLVQNPSDIDAQPGHYVCNHNAQPVQGMLNRSAQPECNSSRTYLEGSSIQFSSIQFFSATTTSSFQSLAAHAYAYSFSTSLMTPSKLSVGKFIKLFAIFFRALTKSVPNSGRRTAAYRSTYVAWISLVLSTLALAFSIIGFTSTISVLYMTPCCRSSSVTICYWLASNALTKMTLLRVSCGCFKA